MNKDGSVAMPHIAALLLDGNKDDAKKTICQEYSYTRFEIEKRVYTLAQTMNQFIRDGLIDRYTGEPNLKLLPIC